MIERIRTEVYFTDSSRVEWKVVDARRRADGKIWKQHAGLDGAERRYFVRYSRPNGARPAEALEVRR